MGINEKLSNIQTAIKAPKNLYNKFGNYKYRNAEGIYEAVKPYLKEQNCSLIVSDELLPIGDRIYVKATAALFDNEGSGYRAAEAYAREPEEKKGMDAAQITGATSSYARKYALNGLFLLDDTKDPDTEEYANENTARSQKAQKTKSATKSTKATNVSKEEKKPEDVTHDEPEEVEIRNENDPINEREITMIRNCISKVGVTEEKVLMLYGKKSLEQFTVRHYNNLIENLDKLKAAVS